MTRSDMISKLKSVGKNYNFKRFSDKQIYMIYLKEYINKKNKKRKVNNYV